jgi:D-alanyl-lipoteichoic acid acyltransferase DltB (MBOAT superfamily)
MGGSAPALGVAAAAVVTFWSVRSDAARRAVLLFATVAIGILLSLRHLEARRLSALLFLLSIVLVFAVWRTVAARPRAAGVLRAGTMLLVAVFVAWKAVGAQSALFRALHLPEKYLPAGAWLGGSYILFRLIHVSIEGAKADFPRIAFPDFFLYVLFPSTLVAGPIARLPQFSASTRWHRPPLADVAEGGRRIVVGVFKKFVVADFIAILPIDFAHAGLSTARMWASLYLFGLQLFFDFAGYSDIAIGAAALVGFRVPENFDAPYLKADIARFWQAWHATLSSWMRDYVFFPLGRLLRRSAPGVPGSLVVLVCQVATMVLIGVWHGFFAGYAIWGAWHGIGLFVHREWSRRRPPSPGANRLWKAGATFATFQFVMIGWVFFYGTSVTESLLVLGRLLGR